MRFRHAFSIAALGLALAAPSVFAEGGLAVHDPDQVLVELAAGNHRYVSQPYSHSSSLGTQRQGLEHGQQPKAIVVGCSDSRVPPELVFDQGLGSLFVIRSAGQALDDSTIGSIEYAAEHLDVPLVIVLGHDQCGAVKAALQDMDHPGKLGRLVSRLKPALVQVPYQPGERVHNAVHANVVHVMAQLSASEPVLAERTRAGRLRIVGGIYDMHTGRVAFMHPNGVALHPAGTRKAAVVPAHARVH